MLRALYTSSTGMMTQQSNIDNIANNLANVNTVGFKKARVDFQDLMYQTIKPAGSSTSAGITRPVGEQLGLGARVAGVTKMHTQGSFMQTGNQLDLTIEGAGYFQIEMPDGSIAYTRNGAFTKNNAGQVVTVDGFPLSPGIVIPDNAEQIFIGQDGTVTAKIAGQVEAADLGQITTARFINPAGLHSIGSNFYKESGASGAPLVGVPGEESLGPIAQGYLEMSNVQLVEEMVNMIIGQRAYEINSKAIITGDEMLQTATNLKR